MKKLSAVLVVLLLAGMVMVITDARTVSAETTITVYFNRAGTIRAMDSPGSGTATVYIFGEGFEEIPPWVSGAQYKIDYGPHITWLADLQLAPASIGSSPLGISIGFGYAVKRGDKFLIQSALIEWNSDCAAAINSSFPVVLRHPAFPDPGPVVTRFPDHAEFLATGRRSQICQRVELDIKPVSCPNHFQSTMWSFIGSPNPSQGGVLPVALLGSATVDVDDIDLSSLRLAGVAPLTTPPIQLTDVGGGDDDNDCECDNAGSPDGRTDISMKFRNADIAAAISLTPPSIGTVVTLTLTGEYNDGMPFEATDCMMVVGNTGKENQQSRVSSFSTSLGLPTPNPFNPVTWITYTIPTSQHVRIAIYDAAGRLVENLVEEVKAPGEYTVEWDAASRPSGVYFCRMQTGNETIVRRATLLK